MVRTLCILLVLGWLSWPTSANDTKPLTTMPIVARSELPDPNFRDAIVLVMNYLNPPPAGLILNSRHRSRSRTSFPI